MKTWLLMALWMPFSLLAQTPELGPSESLLILSLKNKKGMPHKRVKVTFKDVADDQQYQGVTNDQGKVKLALPAGGDFEVRFSNSEIMRKRRIPAQAGFKMQSSYTYEHGEEDWSKKYPPSAAQIAAWESKVAAYPETTLVTSTSRPSRFDERVQLFEIVLADLHNGPLIGEKVYLTATRYNKVIAGQTDRSGRLFLLLPKGSEYTLGFKHDPDYKDFDVPFTLGESSSKIQMKYLGTKEIEKRIAAEKERLRLEEERLAKEIAAFKAYVEELGISFEKGREDEIRRHLANRNYRDPVIANVMNRNKQWENKLIVCDLTGSMSPYSAQLADWYKLVHALDERMQFVFFNDGDNKPDHAKVIGETGGIYYSGKIGIDALITLMATVSAAGGGGDGPENNMEALIKGTKQAESYQDIVMIVDNNAPVKDIALLKDFDQPVHIVLCGNTSGFICLDYLQIAYKTKGSIHTIEEDINELWRITEGKEIKIGGRRFMLLGRKFVEVKDS